MTTLLLLAIWVLFIICLTQGIEESHQEVLEVKGSVLLDWGAAQGTLIKEGQIYRLITATFLHVNLLHILMNSISLLIFLTRFEKIYPLHTPFILVISSITGSTFLIQGLCSASYATVTRLLWELPQQFLGSWEDLSLTSSSTGWPCSATALSALPSLVSLASSSSFRCCSLSDPTSTSSLTWEGLSGDYWHPWLFYRACKTKAT